MIIICIYNNLRKENITLEMKAASGMMLTLLLTSMLTLAFGIQPVKASETIYIMADGSVNPSNAPIQPDGDTYTLTADIYDSIVVEKDNIIVEGNGYTLQGTGNGNGFQLFGRTNVTIRNVRITQFSTGIFLSSSHDNIMTKNVVSSNTQGINMGWSENNTISGNTVASNTGGIIVYQGSENVTVKDNTVTSNTFGIDLGMANWCTVADNNLTNNMFGVWLDHSSNNTFFGNVIKNSVLAMRLNDSPENTIYHNNFIDNTNQVYIVEESFNNVWDDGYPSGGNYWSDYSARYPDAQELDDSGIWDTSYNIDENNQDNYPLMEPWTATAPTIMASLDIEPDTLNLESKGKWIEAYIQLPEDYNPEDIDASTILLNGTIQPILDPKYGFVTDSSEYLVDHDNDGILERMLKFDRATLASWIHQSVGMQSDVSLTITGKLRDGTPFTGTYKISAIWTNHRHPCKR